MSSESKKRVKDVATNEKNERICSRSKILKDKFI